MDNAEQAAGVIETLSKSPETQLMAYQIGFDLYESATQNFLSRVLDHLKKANHVPSSSEKEVVSSSTPVPAEGEGANVETPVTVETTPPPAEAVEAKKPVNEEMKKHWDQMLRILSGEVSIALQLQFLVRSNKTDMTILKQTKESVRVSICHTATVIANAFMHAGTTSDQFLRENLDWLARATNWAKLTATASLGVIHHGHEKEALNLMQSYLPREGGGATAGYSEGGALYALGLIHANHGNDIIDYLLTQLRVSI